MNSQSPLFTIVTVTLNCARNVGGTVDSVLQQTFRDYEYLVKDGGSTDGTVDVVRSFGEESIVTQPDSGIYDAMNQAVALARGRYICFLNAGDALWSPDVLQRVAEHIRRNPEIPFFYGDVFSQEEHPVYGKDPEVTGRLLRYPERFGRLNAFLISMCQQSWFLQTTLLRQRPFDTTYPVKADQEFFHWLLRSGLDYRHLPFPVVRYAGGGYSEINSQQRLADHARLMKTYFTPNERALFFMLQRLRQAYRVIRYYFTGTVPKN